MINNQQCDNTFPVGGILSYELFMGIDIGTTGIRAALFNEKGYQVALSYREYPMICPEVGASELEPDAILDAMLYVVRDCMESVGDKRTKLNAIGLSTQLFSLIAVDRQGNCLTNVITWADTRPLKEANLIGDEFNCHELYQRTGCRVQHPMYPLSKILWIRRNYNEIFKNTYKFISIKEYIIYRLFGEFLIDMTDASATACFNIHKFTWDEDILKEVLGIKPDKLGTPVDCVYILKNMKESFAGKMGICSDTPVIIGSGDGILANIGCGVFDDTKLSSTVGTSGAIRTAANAPLLDDQGRTWCYCFTEDVWVAGGAINNGGIVLKWLRDMHDNEYEQQAKILGYTNTYDLFNEYVSKIKPGSDGLIFLPYLTGQRSPHWKADARGIISGIQLNHGKEHLMRAAMEGVMYNMFSIYEAIMQLNSNAREIIANGGYANSDIWLQIQADIFNKAISVAGIKEAAAFGAAFVAMAGIGAIDSLTEKNMLPAMKPNMTIEPIKANVDIYQRGYVEFKKVYDVVYGS